MRGPSVPGVSPICYDPGTMASRLSELVGRVMIDPDFLAELQRTPETVLAQYELTEHEAATIRQALARLAETPPRQRDEMLRIVLLRRVAT